MSAVDERSAPSAFRLSRDRLAELATGGGSPGTIRFLADTQYSRRQLALLALRDLAVLDLRPLPSIDDAWAILDRAKARAPATFRSIIMYPPIGNWAAYAIREHSEGAGAESAPAWVDFGQIHAVALVVAAGCGLDWRTRVPLRSGRAILPGLGQASFDEADQWDSAVAETAGGGIRLSHGRTTVTVPADPRQDGDGWQGLRILTTGTDPVLEVALDDLDPLRDLADPVDPERLTDVEVAGWQSMLDGAWAMLCRDDPATARAMAAGAVSSLSPLGRADQAGDDEIRSASTAEAFGAILLSTPQDVVEFAAALVHEYRHIKLGCLMHLCALHHDDERPELYAPWRDDPRPIGGLVQGIYAFHGIAGFHRTRIAASDGVERRTAQFAYALTRAQTIAGLAAARASDGLTELGREFLDELSATMRPWADDAVPASIDRLTGLALAAHRTTWLLRHRRPAPGTADAVARAWSADEPIDLASLAIGPVEPSAGPPPRTTEWIRPFRLAVNTPLPATTPETALAAGDPATAKAQCLAGIEADPDDVDAWTGLALASLDLGDTAAARALTERPDLVHAGYQALAGQGTAPAPDVLSRWAGREQP
ncbi:HEXXH motif-containing putative peptide modification protein [Actinoplanes sp. NBRC 103695]|uniref:aKG-HExxH-type peptide beta-hydroxylase n=1 Tax=Actinoplanes sp. NBRC 103695 TaxID=3032202 RepID=UPI0024A1A909|nr:HEXXH motif-containing putative peptide modification protein [Actinoplanes sp. NBRC 103695]GLY99913.1 HEXXH motif domain-containing protein [Actinoplanes sp. NBRC 103695]